MGSLQSDVLYAVRSLRAAPAFCLLGVVTLGLGIACLSAVFAIVESVVLRPLPYPEPDRLVVVLRSDVEGATPSVSWPDLRDWRDQSTGFDGLTGYANASMTFEWDGGAEEIPGAYVLPDFFDVFGVPLHLGRSFSPSEAVFGGAEAIVLSHHMWTERFGADPQVIGTTVPLASGPATIIGVAGAGFAAPNDRSDYWLPLQEDELLAEAGLPTGRRTLAFIEVLGRMERGADVSDVQTRLRGLALGIDEGAGKTEEQLSRVTLHSLAEWTVIEVRRGLYVLFAAALLVLLVAVANAAALGVSRATSRRAEAALRAALGASPHSLLRQALLEGAIVAISAGVVGTLVAGLSLPTLMDFAPQGLPRGTSVDVRASTLLFASAATFVTGLFFGMGPAVVAARVAPSGILSLGRGAGPSAAELRPQRFLVVSQVALTVVLLTGAMLLSLSFSRVLGVERGFAAEGVLVASLAPSEQRYPTPADLEVLYDEILLQVRALPGVSHASTTYTPPLSNREFRTTVLPTTGPAVGEDPLWATTVVAAQDYFAASGISLLRGRDFDSNDRLSSEPVVIVNELMANRFWPGEDAVGKQVSFAGSIGGVADSFDRAFFPTQPMTVIGVAANVRRAQLSAPPKPEYYRPHSQVRWGSQYLVVQVEVDPSSVSSELRTTISSVDPTIPLGSIELVSQQVADSVAPERFRMLLLLVFAGLTCGLAMVGLYAVTTLAVSRRVGELGVRLALGANPSGLRRDVFGDAFRLVAVGVGLGVVLSVLATRLLATSIGPMLFETNASDVRVYAGVALFVFLVALIASVAPAQRASRVNPLVLLTRSSL